MQEDYVSRQRARLRAGQPVRQIYFAALARPVTLVMLAVSPASDRLLKPVASPVDLKLGHVARPMAVKVTVERGQSLLLPCRG